MEGNKSLNSNSHLLLPAAESFLVAASGFTKLEQLSIYLLLYSKVFF